MFGDRRHPGCAASGEFTVCGAVNGGIAFAGD